MLDKIPLKLNTFLAKWKLRTCISSYILINFWMKIYMNNILNLQPLCISVAYFVPHSVNEEREVHSMQGRKNENTLRLKMASSYSWQS